MRLPSWTRTVETVERHPWLALGPIVLAGALARWLFVTQMDVPMFDPWRHLQLIENVRRGLGFTLFDGQPYLWYSPVWYVLCAALPSGVGAEWLSALLSLAAAVLLFVFLRSTTKEGRLPAAAAGALLAALFGPLVAFTCHYGSEAFALFLILAGLVLCARGAGILSAALSGALLGTALVARMNFAFNTFLFVPFVRTTRRGLAFAGGLALPVVFTFVRNYRAIREYPYIFSWDGLATRSADYTLLSTLVVQMQTSVQEATRRLYERLLPDPQWLGHWEIIAFILFSVICLIVGRRLWFILAGVGGLAYFLLLDKTLNSNFFRIHLALFPAFFMGIALVVADLHRRGRVPALIAWGLVGLTLVAGAGYLSPELMYPLEDVTPPPELLTENAYMVTSGFYQPESLIYRFPDKHFVGMPLDPKDFEEFRRTYREYRHILWHDFGVQDELVQYLLGSGRYEVERVARNMYGREYLVLAERAGAEEHAMGWNGSRLARSRH